MSLVWQLRGNNLPQPRARHVFLHAGRAAPELGHGHRRGPPLHPLHEYGGATALKWGCPMTSNHVKPPNFRQFWSFCMFFVCFMSMLGRFRSISSNLGFHAAEGITANLCDANTNWVAQFQIFPPKPKGQRSDRPIDGQHLALNPALLHFRSAPTVLHHQRQDLGQKKWQLKESIYWYLPY